MIRRQGESAPAPHRATSKMLGVTFSEAPAPKADKHKKSKKSKSKVRHPLTGLSSRSSSDETASPTQMPAIRQDRWQTLRWHTHPRTGLPPSVTEHLARPPARPDAALLACLPYLVMQEHKHRKKKSKEKSKERTQAAAGVLRVSCADQFRAHRQDSATLLAPHSFVCGGLQMVVLLQNPARKAGSPRASVSARHSSTSRKQHRQKGALLPKQLLSTLPPALTLLADRPSASESDDSSSGGSDREPGTPYQHAETQRRARPHSSTGGARPADALTPPGDRGGIGPVRHSWQTEWAKATLKRPGCP